MRAGRRIRSAGLLALLSLGAAQAQVINPLSLIGRAVTTAADLRTADEVKNDVAIAADANRRLAEDRAAEWKGVSLLVFAQHVVLAGAVRSDAAKRRVAAVVGEDRRVRSLQNELIVIRKEGDDGSFVGDAVLEEKVNVALTAAKGVGSINMRWKSVGGRLVLMGIARSKEEAALAQKEARAVEGVKSVKAHLRIVPGK